MTLNCFLLVERVRVQRVLEAANLQTSWKVVTGCRKIKHYIYALYRRRKSSQLLRRIAQDFPLVAMRPCYKSVSLKVVFIFRVFTTSLEALTHFPEPATIFKINDEAPGFVKFH